MIPDILILNAGVMRSSRVETKQGYEACFGTNYLAHFQLTRLLLPDIVAKARSQKTTSRIIAVASNTHIIANMHWNDLQLKNPGAFALFKAYGQSKLACSFYSLCDVLEIWSLTKVFYFCLVILWVRFLANKFIEWKCADFVTINSIHPGIIDTELARSAPTPAIFYYPRKWFFAYFFKTVHQGAQTSVWAAISHTLAKSSGFYLTDCRINTPTRLKDGEEEKLWKTTCDLLKLSPEKTWL
jgi:NAD(P)-dependent dehydrogenase (short-subunit alcohol dehydrogenase family)